ncbi:response regulator [Pseudotabrizicola algicola]|uniref:histidine kinase n=1 Tax=Pseudotabrizicola algicola TaxID=2709381 RepID=A0A6B3RHX7_9RHOB|nr:response regulator [Pseudotabrizicola algicola]NEX45590.1 response regulator [Pseudotabrizicola algicola]
MPDRAIRFLLVDDIQENLVALEALLRRDGLEIHKAHSAAEALEMMLVNDYALALLDVHMPDTDGYELAELMRGAERTRRLPIIFVTAADIDETRRFRGYEAGAVDFIFKPIDPVILKSKCEVFFQLGQQARDLARQRDEMRAIAQHRDQAMARLKAHADNSPLATIELDCGLVLRAWSQGAERIFGHRARDMLGRPVGETGWLGAETIDALRAWIAADSGPDAAPRYTMEAVAFSADGREIACEFHGSSLREADSQHMSLTLQVLDITERRQAEEMRSLLIGELNHRIKNTLANVQAIARQTLRQSAGLEDFDRSFSGRLQALARAHSILSDATWSSAPLDGLIDDQVQAGTLVGDRLHRSGPQVQISPENMLRLALTLHELGTNAQKYGAFSVPGGEVLLSWRHEGAGLVLHWQERGGPAVSPPTRKGFGHTLIDASAGGDEGSVEVDWQPRGVAWTIRLAHGVTAAEGAGPVQKPAAVAAVSEDALIGRRVLLIEDEPLVALDLSCELEDVGAEVVAVARTLKDALIAAENQSIDLALLDGNLGGEKVDGVAEILTKRGIPFCFVSGYGPEHLPVDFQSVPMVQKPVDPAKLRAVLEKMVADLPLVQSRAAQAMAV